MQEEYPICVCKTEADAEEMYMDLVMEVRYDNFCYDWLEYNLSLDICLNDEHTCSCGCYWIACEILTL
jgi:hypothetical protein